MNKLALIAAAGLGASAASASVTFDLSGIMVDSLANGSVTITLMEAAAGTGNIVDSIDWNITYGAPAGSVSWSEELAIELVAPGAASSGLGPGAGNGDADGNIHFGSTPVSAFNAARGINPDIELGGNGTTGSTINSVGSTALLAGMNGDGVWTLNIGEIFNDTGVDGQFGQGSFITVNFIPAPGAAALFGLGGLAAARRRR